MPWSRVLRRRTGCYEKCSESSYTANFVPYLPETRRSFSFGLTYMTTRQLTANTWQLLSIQMRAHLQPRRSANAREHKILWNDGIVYHAIPVKHKYARQSLWVNHGYRGGMPVFSRLAGHLHHVFNIEHIWKDMHDSTCVNLEKGPDLMSWNLTVK